MKPKIPRRSNKPDVRTQKRDRYWPDAESRVWHRSMGDGFTTLPKTLPLILEIMERAVKGGPALSKTYLTLWCNTWDNSYVDVQSEDVLAFESGFSQANLARRRLEWRKRMQLLEELGFIGAEKSEHAYRHIILWNPHKVVSALLEKEPRIGKALKDALLDKATEIGARDLLDEFEKKKNDGIDSKTEGKRD